MIKSAALKSLIAYVVIFCFTLSQVIPAGLAETMPQMNSLDGSFQPEVDPQEVTIDNVPAIDLSVNTHEGFFNNSPLTTVDTTTVVDAEQAEIPEVDFSQVVDQSIRLAKNLETQNYDMDGNGRVDTADLDKALDNANRAVENQQHLNVMTVTLAGHAWVVSRTPKGTWQFRNYGYGQEPDVTYVSDSTGEEVTVDGQSYSIEEDAMSGLVTLSLGDQEFQGVWDSRYRDILDVNRDGQLDDHDVDQIAGMVKDAIKQIESAVDGAQRLARVISVGDYNNVDFNGDGLINRDDETLALSWMKGALEFRQYLDNDTLLGLDRDGDGILNDNDYTLMQRAFEDAVPAAAIIKFGLSQSDNGVQVLAVGSVENYKADHKLVIRDAMVFGDSPVIAEVQNVAGGEGLYSFSLALPLFGPGQFRLRLEVVDGHGNIISTDTQEISIYGNDPVPLDPQPTLPVTIDSLTATQTQEGVVFSGKVLNFDPQSKQQVYLKTLSEGEITFEGDFGINITDKIQADGTFKSDSVLGLQIGQHQAVLRVISWEGFPNPEPVIHTSMQIDFEVNGFDPVPSQEITPFKVAVATASNGVRNLTVDVAANGDATIVWDNQAYQGKFNSDTQQIVLTFPAGGDSADPTIGRWTLQFRTNPAGVTVLDSLERVSPRFVDSIKANILNYDFYEDGLFQAQSWRFDTDQYKSARKTSYGYIRAGDRFLVNSIFETYSSEGVYDKYDERFWTESASRNFYAYDDAGDQITTIFASSDMRHGISSFRASYSHWDGEQLISAYANDIPIDISDQINSANYDWTNSRSDRDVVDRYAHTKTGDYYDGNPNRPMGANYKFSIQSLRISAGENGGIAADIFVPKFSYTRDAMGGFFRRNTTAYIVQGTPDFLSGESDDIRFPFEGQSVNDYAVAYGEAYQYDPAIKDNRYMGYGLWFKKWGTMPDGSFSDQILAVVDYPREKTVTLEGKEFLIIMDAEGIIQLQETNQAETKVREIVFADLLKSYGFTDPMLKSLMAKGLVKIEVDLENRKAVVSIDPSVKLAEGAVNLADPLGADKLPAEIYYKLGVVLPVMFGCDPSTDGASCPPPPAPDYFLLSGEFQSNGYTVQLRYTESDFLPAPGQGAPEDNRLHAVSVVKIDDPCGGNPECLAPVSIELIKDISFHYDDAGNINAHIVYHDGSQGAIASRDVTIVNMADNQYHIQTVTDLDLDGQVIVRSEFGYDIASTNCAESVFGGSSCPLPRVILVRIIRTDAYGKKGQRLSEITDIEMPMDSFPNPELGLAMQTFPDESGIKLFFSTLEELLNQALKNESLQQQVAGLSEKAAAKYAEAKALPKDADANGDGVLDANDLKLLEGSRGRAVVLVDELQQIAAALEELLSQNLDLVQPVLDHVKARIDGVGQIIAAIDDSIAVVRAAIELQNRITELNESAEAKYREAKELPMAPDADQDGVLNQDDIDLLSKSHESAGILKHDLKQIVTALEELLPQNPVLVQPILDHVKELMEGVRQIITAIDDSIAVVRAAIELQNRVMKLNGNAEAKYREAKELPMDADANRDGVLNEMDLRILSGSRESADLLAGDLKQIVTALEELLPQNPGLVQPVLDHVKAQIDGVGQIIAMIDESIVVVRAAIELRNRVVELNENAEAKYREAKELPMAPDANRDGVLNEMDLRILFGSRESADLLAGDLKQIVTALEELLPQNPALVQPALDHVKELMEGVRQIITAIDDSIAVVRAAIELRNRVVELNENAEAKYREAKELPMDADANRDGVLDEMDLRILSGSRESADLLAGDLKQIVTALEELLPQNPDLVQPVLDHVKAQIDGVGQIIVMIDESIAVVRAAIELRNRVVELNENAEAKYREAKELPMAPDANRDGVLNEMDLRILSGSRESADLLAGDLKQIVTALEELLPQNPDLVQPVLDHVKAQIDGVGQIIARIDESIAVVRAAIELRNRVVELNENAEVKYREAKLLPMASDANQDGVLNAADLVILSASHEGAVVRADNLKQIAATLEELLSQNPGLVQPVLDLVKQRIDGVGQIIATIDASILVVRTPIAAAQSVAMNEDGSLKIQLTARSVGGGVLTFAIVSQPANGTLTIEPATGKVVFTPNANFNGKDSFTFIADNGFAKSEAATVDITINAVNDAPVVIALTLTGDEDGEITGKAANDVDGDALTFVFVSRPKHGTVTLNEDGTFVYKPKADYNGTDSFSFKANDGKLNSPVGKISLNITAVNDAPVVTSLTRTGNEDGTITGKAIASDIDKDALNFALVDGPSHGTVTFKADGTFVYKPAANYNGTDSFTFKANDGKLDSPAVGTVSLNITAVNDAPVATSLTLTGDEDGEVAGQVTASDVEGDALTFVLVSKPAHGTVTFKKDGTFVYKPTANYNGTDSFTFRANDGKLNSPVGTVSLSLAAVNDAPVIQPIANRSIRQGRNLALPKTAITASDVDKDSLTFIAYYFDSFGIKRRLSLTRDSSGGWMLETNALEKQGTAYLIYVAAQDPSGAEATTSFGLTVS